MKPPYCSVKLGASIVRKITFTERRDIRQENLENAIIFAICTRQTPVSRRTKVPYPTTQRDLTCPHPFSSSPTKDSSKDRTPRHSWEIRCHRNHLNSAHKYRQFQPHGHDIPNTQIWPWYTVAPSAERGRIMGATNTHWFLSGSYLSTDRSWHAES